jgi:hypothetical protein
MRRASLLFAVTFFWPVLAAGAPLGATPLEPGLVGRKDVIFFESFETSTWYSHWKLTKLPQNCSLVGSGYKGQALEVSVPKGQHYGTSFGFDFAKFSLAEPEQLYYRYYLRFDSSWDGASGGKLPGFGGTYGVAGWGGKPSHGDDGWSARGTFKGGGTGKTWIGYYVYHADMTGTYGSTWLWTTNNLGLLTNNKWYCVEGYVRLNKPGSKDGVLRGWVDGKLAFEKTGLNFRTVSKLKVERFWFDIYYGGTWTAASDMALHADNLVVASGRVGCYQASPKPDAGATAPDAGATDGAKTPADAASASDAQGAADAGGADGPGQAPPDGKRAQDGCSCGLGGPASDGRPAPALLVLVLVLVLVLIWRIRRRLTAA